MSMSRKGTPLIMPPVQYRQLRWLIFLFTVLYTGVSPRNQSNTFYMVIAVYYGGAFHGARGAIATVQRQKTSIFILNEKKTVEPIFIGSTL